MLRITQNNSASGASKYFDEGLAKADYYAKDNQEIVGKWGGNAVEKLGLATDVKKEDFDKLAHNINPATERQLNPRHTDTRKVGYDFTFSAPKSASILYAVKNDERIRAAFESSVSATMRELEKDMMTQKGQGKQKRHERTGNMIWAEFTHKTARPVGGEADCHLHTHCFAFNSTWNEEKERFQAGEFGNIKKNAPYYEAAFDARFAKQMEALGYNIERRGLSWEVEEIDRSLIDKFSNRTKLIEAEAQKRGLKSDKLKSELGAKTRNTKRKGESYEELQKVWSDRLNEQEHETILSLGIKADQKEKDKVTAKEALDYAMEHTFERKSAVSEKTLMKDALKRGFGSVTPEEIALELAKRDTIKSEIKNNTYLTTREVLAVEKAMIQNVREGRGVSKPIHPNYQSSTDFLNKEQKKAIHHALSSKDRIIMIEGGAGTGKTTLMKEVKQGVEESGQKIFAFAPSAAASRGVMRDEGFKTADTISKFLADKNIQDKTKGQIIWIDEAGMVGNNTMNRVLKIANQQNARVLLTGDTRQHTSVEAGDAMRIIQERGGIKVARVNTIQRQRNAKQYKQAVKQISSGNINSGFAKLDAMGSIKEIADKEERQLQIATDFIAAKKAKKTALVIAPTHKEGEEVTNNIRQKLKDEGILDTEEKTFLRQKSLNYTDAEKQDSNNYQKGMTVQFHQNAKGFVAGRKYDVIGQKEGNVIVSNAMGIELKLNTVNSKRFNVYEQKEIKLAKGDSIRITQNGKSIEEKRLNNGNMYQVEGFDKHGNIKLSNNSKIDKNFRNFNHGYVVTSHSSQGKTVDRVLIAQSNTSFPASSQKQFYVSVSRAREQVSIYTNDKEGLKNTIQDSGNRMTASNVYDISKQQKFISRSNYQKETDQTNTPTKQVSYAK